MLDIAFIRENTEVVKKAAQQKKVDVDIDRLLELDDKRRELTQKIEEIRAQRNQIAQKAKGGKPTKEDIELGKELKNKLNDLENKLEPVEEEFDKLNDLVPNVISDDTPIGPDESGNEVRREYGKKPDFDFEPLPHWELGKNLSLIDSERAAKISGARFHFLKGDLVLLEMALIRFVMDALTDEDTLKGIIKKAGIDTSPKPFTPVLPPVMIKPDVFAKTGRLNPAEDKYYVEKDDLYLIGSAEQSLAPLHMDEVLDEDTLPVRYLGFSTAFRREAGTYGKDTRGILRVHQFDKLEMESIVAPEFSDAEHYLHIAIQEYIMQQLGLHYQVIAICSGDMGKPDFRQTDINAWMPGQGAYRETHTADHNTDFQSRRLNIKYRKADNSTGLVHMHDGTATAGRTLIAIMEQYQTKKGTIKIPEVLQPYIGKEEIR